MGLTTPSGLVRGVGVGGEGVGVGGEGVGVEGEGVGVGGAVVGGINKCGIFLLKSLIVKVHKCVCQPKNVPFFLSSMNPESPQT